ncbi:MAG TPA: rhodanese-like domain-containing protein [Candidatus Nanoarchaeia archaeon]
MDSKKLGILLIVVLIALVGGFFLISGSENVEDETPDVRNQAQVIEDITPKEAHSLISDNKESGDFVIVDLRTPDEYASGHIEGATNLDYYSDTFRDELENLDKNKTYLIHCQSGRRSSAALEIMKNLGFKKVYNMTGGMVEWQAKGLPATE